MSDMEEKTTGAPEAKMAIDEPQPQPQPELKPQSQAEQDITDPPTPPQETEAPNVPVVPEVANDDDMSSLSPVSSRAADETPDSLHITEHKDSPLPIDSAEPDAGQADPTPQLEPEDTEMVDADPGAAADNEAEEEEEEPAVPVSHYPKRKRASTYREVEDYDENEEVAVQPDEPSHDHAVAVEVPVKRHGANGIKGVIVGHWRDSTAPTKAQKHAVIAFIDIRDRLRTRIQPTNMKGEPIDLNLYPIPPGPGGSWTTFGGIVFENQLVGLEQFHIKEFVKIRSDADPNETADQKFVADKRAVKEAIRRVAANPPPETPANAQPAIAYGDDIPDSVRELDDQKRKKRRLGSGAAALVQHHAPSPATLVRTPPPERAIQPAPMVHSPAEMAMAPRAGDPPLPTTTLNNLPGARPTKVLVGTWSHSSEPRKEDRHAVYGILGINDMFRVKVVRETQSGRFLDGNFPQGAGALWITYDQVELDDHLADLTRAEVKEYVRYRQYQMESGESDKDREENIKIAVEQAKLRWAAFEKKADALKEDDQDNQTQALNGGGSSYGYGGAQQFPSTPDTRNGLRSSIRETRQSLSSQPSHPGDQSLMSAGTGQNIAPAPSMDAKTETTPNVKLDGRTKAGRLAKAQAAAAAAARREAENAAAAAHMGGRPIEPRPATRSRRSSADALERTHSLAQREVARAEANAKRDERHEASRDIRAASGSMIPSGGPGQAQGLGMDPNIERLDKVWQAQEATRINKYQAEDAIFHAGIKYMRRTTGPFKNKLASHGAILNIDGEDYVEYRVLLKPSFF